MTTKKDCAVCVNQFKPCQSCDGSVVQWRRVVCCPEHFYSHMVIVEYRDKAIDKATAKEQLEDVIERFGKVDFNNNIQALVDEILATEADETPIIEEVQYIPKKLRKK